MEKDQLSNYCYWSLCSNVKVQRVGIRSPMNLCYPQSRIKGGRKQTHVALGLSWAACPYWILRTGFSGLTRKLSCHSIIEWLNPACIWKLQKPDFSSVPFSSGVSAEVFQRTSEQSMWGLRPWSQGLGKSQAGLQHGVWLLLTLSTQSSLLADVQEGEGETRLFITTLPPMHKFTDAHG